MGGWVAGSLENKANSAQALLELGLRLSLAIMIMIINMQGMDRELYLFVSQLDILLSNLV